MIPHFIKYMGSKRDILEDIQTVVDAMSVDADCFCDLFAGTAIVSFAMSDRYRVISNDIQRYSAVFTHAYFGDYSNNKDVIEVLKEIREYAELHVNNIRSKYSRLQELYEYDDNVSYEDFLTLETAQQGLLDMNLGDDYVFFTQHYSGTYWSLAQCLWIDALRKSANLYQGSSLYYAVLASLIFAMSYSSQSTGHFAQFRKITKNNYLDILNCRKRDVFNLFSKKLSEVMSLVKDNQLEYEVRTDDFRDCLKNLPQGSIVYADPPYSNVHYSRFYHVIETLVRYDSPNVEHNGRYRDDRHQSPFDQKRNVRSAFASLFKGVKDADSHIVLSYSNNGMLTPEEIMEIGDSIFGSDYESSMYEKEYSHMKMGRSDEYKMDVKELLITYRKL